MVKKVSSAEAAKRALEALAKLRALLRAGRISHEDVVYFSKPFIKTIDRHAAIVARQHGVSPRKFSLAGFLR